MLMCTGCNVQLGFRGLNHIDSHKASSLNGISNLHSNFKPCCMFSVLPW